MTSYKTNPFKVNSSKNNNSGFKTNTSTPSYSNNKFKNNYPNRETFAKEKKIVLKPEDFPDLVSSSQQPSSFSKDVETKTSLVFTNPFSNSEENSEEKNENINENLATLTYDDNNKLVIKYPASTYKKPKKTLSGEEKIDFSSLIEKWEKYREYYINLYGYDTYLKIYGSYYCFYEETETEDEMEYGSDNELYSDDYEEI
jgi:hypothetical protein